jgi:hypothetical protein
MPAYLRCDTGSSRKQRFQISKRIGAGARIK